MTCESRIWFVLHTNESNITIKSLENVFKAEIKIKVAMQIKIITNKTV